MFRRSSEGLWRSSLLDALGCVDHGFATRHLPQWPDEYARVRQVHSAMVHEASADSPEGDGLVTHVPDRWIGIRTADCVPVLLADPRTRSVAAVHAGWRGTAAGIIPEALERMRALYGTHSADIVAAIGPCIASCCFEVGPDVGAQFPDDFEQDPPRVDLVAANRRQLYESGVAESRIDVSGLCTMCDAAEFESFRRDRERSGRMVSAIRILASA
ncbi:MAG TPA: peptidoglycan editing factor PgeF [Bryobacteraceae bacterium]|nr:peptidoglycan editing factor PgeF [Bryobacteraceae bacterium]